MDGHQFSLIRRNHSNNLRLRYGISGNQTPVDNAKQLNHNLTPSIVEARAEYSDLSKFRGVFESNAASISRSLGERSAFLFFMVHLCFGGDSRVDAAGGERAGYARMDSRIFRSPAVKIKRHGPDSSGSV
jgi:hypothetical protein